MQYLRPPIGVAFIQGVRQYQEFQVGAYFWPPRFQMRHSGRNRIYNTRCPYTELPVSFIADGGTVIDDIRTVEEAKKKEPNAMLVLSYNSEAPNATRDGLVLRLYALREIAPREEVVIRSRTYVYAMKEDPQKGFYLNLAPNFNFSDEKENIFFSAMAPRFVNVDYDELLGIRELDNQYLFTLTHCTNGDYDGVLQLDIERDDHNQQHINLPHTFQSHGSAIDPRSIDEIGFAPADPYQMDR